jgi:hypothetical protein
MLIVGPGGLRWLCGVELGNGIVGWLPVAKLVGDKSFVDPTSRNWH